MKTGKPSIPEFSEERFWQKLRRHGQRAGTGIVHLALKLYYAALNPKTPKWARLRIYAALAYFVFPLDALPDFVPLAGYSDDLALLLLAMGAVAFYITDEVKIQAAEKMRSWFGPDASPGTAPEKFPEKPPKKKRPLRPK